MVKVGDRIALSSFKGADREGVVTEVLGAMVRVRWSSGQESAVVPTPGTLTIRETAAEQGNPTGGPKTSSKTPSRAGVNKAATKAGSTKATPKGASKPTRRR